MKKAFTLAEVLIVVAILGILAAIVLPEFRSHTQQAKESAGKSNLRVLRNAIELFTAQNNGVPPGYATLTGLGPVSEYFFKLRMMGIGRTLPEIPKNPFNNLVSILVLADDAEFPAEATGTYGWVYQPRIKRIQLDYPGSDTQGVSYYDY